MASPIRLLDLAGRTAVVTGSSAGIGRAVCDGLIAQGCSVFGLDVTPPAGSTDSPSSHASSASPPPSRTHLTCDLRDPASIREAVARLPQRLDYVVNVAGRDPKYSLAEGSEKEWGEILDLNLRAQYLLIRESLSRLERGEGKSIVNMASINYRLGVPRRTAYTVSKTGILGLTRGLSRELGSKGIRINTISPGWVFTETQKKAFFDDPVEGPRYLQYLRDVQSLPEKRISPEDIANHVLFLLSSASSAATGSNFVVDAGWILE
jgi:NAD(P)-dependent dehydrogenase (short-subunit alcohol dehydrogenase family)